ncbi:MAG: response regulator [Pseudomonadota bacterium]
MTDQPIHKILVADDEEVIREACDRILRRAGHDVRTAPEGKEAWRLIQQEHFDLAFLDIKMPIMDGLAVMNLIRKENIDLPVVVITGHGAAETAAEAIKAGAIDFLTKPFSPNELRQAAAKALNRAGRPVRRAGDR